MFESGKADIECPFCHKVGIGCFRIPVHREPHTSRISGKSATRYFSVPEKVNILSGCPNCGKTKNEIQKAIDTGKTKVLTHEERIEMLKKRGLPLILGSKKE